MVQGVQFRRGTTAEHSVFTGQSGEITVDTDKNVSVIHDGATVGGHPLVGTSTTQRITNKDINGTNINVSGVSTLSGGVQGIGIYSGGNLVTTGIITALNFVGSGNTFAVVGNRIDISIAGGGGGIGTQWVTNSAGISTLSNVGIGTTNPQETGLTVLGKIVINQDAASNNRLIFRGVPGTAYRWNIDNDSSNNFRIFREDDATSANGVVRLNIDAAGNVTAEKFTGDGSGLTGIVGSGSGVIVRDDNTTIGTAGTINFGANLSVSPISSGIVTVTITDNVSVSGILTANQVYTSNNGNGQNVRIGDDLWIGDINIANTIRFSGAQNSDRAFVVFGNSDSVALGRTGTGPLYYGGDLTLAGNATAATTRFQSVGEETTRIDGNTASLVYNTGGGNIAICTNPTGDITLAVTGIPVDSSFNDTSITFSVFVNQTGTARSCTAVTLNGFNATIRWAGGSLANAITGVTTSNGMDIYSFTGINTVGSASTTANYYLLGVVNGGYR